MLKIYNSLTRTVEEFKPLNSPQVGMYTCGPTVYNFAHIGNFRTYTTSDILLRVLEYIGYDVKYIMNLTDVGHLTGDNLGDADTGEDRIEKSARAEGKTAWEIAKFYSDAFFKDFDLLHLTQPEVFAKATDHIKEQIDLIKRLDQKGFTYQTSDGIYFDTSMFHSYGKLSNLDQIKEGARVEINPEKKNPQDFALWKFSKPEDKRQMEWDSPWGRGFPGWHIECSAMALKYLGDSYKGQVFYGDKSRTIDIHVGGIDLRETHHPNEIAQAEAATGKPFVNYWVHSAFMLVQGEKMSKSLHNVYRLYDLTKMGYDPLALRYLYLQTHYRQEMNFTFPALDGAQNALKKLREVVMQYDTDDFTDEALLTDYEVQFSQALNDDLNTPQALAVVWGMINENRGKAATLKTLLFFDKVLGLDLKNAHKYLEAKKVTKIPEKVKELIAEREDFRKNREFSKADHVRAKINKLGYEIIDTKKGVVINRILNKNSNRS